MSATGIAEQLFQPDASRVGRVWRVVCPLEAVIPGRGIAAMVGGTQVAVFRGEWCLTPFDAGASEAVLAIEDPHPFSGGRSESVVLGKGGLERGDTWWGRSLQKKIMTNEYT